MRRPHLAVVAVVVLAIALVAAVAPPLRGTTEAPAAGSTLTAPARAAVSATPPVEASYHVSATATPAVTTASATPPATSGSLASAVRGTITSATRALTAATSDDRVVYAAALRARTAGDYSYAIDAFHTVVVHGGVLAPVASLRMAQALVSADRRPEAATAFTATLARDDLPPQLLSATRFDAADNAVAMHQPDAALTFLDAIRDDTGASSFDRSAAAWQAAQVRRDAGDQGWTADAAAAITLQPVATSASDALDAIAAFESDGGTTVDVPPLTAAYVRYRAYDNTDATKRYRAVVLDPASAHDAAIASFYLGALDERASNTTSALADYAASLAADPTGPLADDARYWRARIYEERGDTASAVSEFDRLVRDFPTSSFAPDSRLRAALDLALHGDDLSALVRLRTIATDPATARSNAATAARWDQVFRAQYGLPADPSLDPPALDPVALASLLGAHTTDPLPASALLEHPVAPTDEAAIDPWMTSAFGPRPDAKTSVLDDPRYVLGRTLVGVGETSVGEAILRSLVSSEDGYPYALLDLARAARDIDLPYLETIAARRILDPLSTQQQLSAPKSLLALSFPTAYLSETDAAASEWSLPPLLLTALMRQESAFNATAGSGAGALGLTQVTPGTGELIAKALDVPWSTSSLFDPAISLRFGGYYLSTQLDQFHGDLLAALAAYNAGPGNASRWESAAPFTGADGFILAVDFSETDAYLARVLENYAWYRYIYAGATQPSLP